MVVFQGSETLGINQELRMQKDNEVMIPNVPVRPTSVPLPAWVLYEDVRQTKCQCPCKSPTPLRIILGYKCTGGNTHSFALRGFHSLFKFSIGFTNAARIVCEPIVITAKKIRTNTPIAITVKSNDV